ncbi:hypothetical protein OAL57_00405 [bacterium]|nr:hypothetical protein [bacterium]
MPDQDIFWAVGAIIKAITVNKKEHPSAVLSTSPNQSVHLVGLFLKKFYGIHWVVEFRDPWTMNPFVSRRTNKVLDYLDNYLEEIVVKNADRINVTSAEYKNEFLEKYSFLESNQIVNIPNGYDPEDFEKKNTGENKLLTITHSGDFYSERSSVNFIHAMLKLLEEGYVKEREILVKFIGTIDPLGLKLILDSKYKGCFLLAGKVSHPESLREIQAADILLLVPGPGHGTMPGKFYEYLAAKKPIFCIANQGPPKKYIEEFRLGITVDEFDVDNIVLGLGRLIRSVFKSEFLYPDTENLLEKFNRKAIAGEMAKILDKTLSN